MSKCPVCKTECHSNAVCHECGFDDIAPTFVNQADVEEWLNSVVEPYRYKYWQCLSDFKISGKTVVEYLGDAENVVIPYGIEVVGKESFLYNNTLVNVFLPDTVKIIETSAFEYADVENITLPYGLEKVESNAFSGTKLQHVVIPGNCRVIEDSAFALCEKLKSVIVSHGVTTLSHFAFQGCYELEYIMLPETVLEIGEGSLTTGCSKTRIIVDARNPRYYVQSNCLIDKNTSSIVAGFLNEEGFLVIPDTPNVTSIGPWAFEGQDAENYDIIPSNIKSIGKCAFSNCYFSIVLPNTLTYIGSYAFSGSNCSIFAEASRKPDGWSDIWLIDMAGLPKTDKKVYWRDEWSNAPRNPYLSK